MTLEPNFAVIDTGGWGVRLSISFFTYDEIKSMLKRDVRLFVHMVVKDDSIELVGFSEAVERQAFILLNKVPGIGTKVALAILSLFDVPRLKACILAEDAKSLMTVPGIGKKTAQRAIIELKDRIKNLPVDSKDYGISNEIYEAKEVLGSLGFSSNEVQKVLKSLSENQVACNGVEDIVKNALKKLSK